MPITGLSTKFIFQSAALDPGTFRVLDFEGEEAISQLFRFEINLISDQSDIDLESVLEKTAFLGLERDGELRKIHGIVSEFEQREKGTVHVHYRAVLVPRLWKLTLRQQNQVHQEQKVGEIIEQELKDAGFTGQDYEIKLQEKHPKREYVVQYQESDFSFISRLMEHEGIFYYFVHDDKRDKVVIADKNEKFDSLEGEATVIYRPPAGIAEADKESVLSLVCRQKRIPKEVVLKDYNWRTPSLDLTVKSTVDPKGEGLFCEYGDHYKDKDGEGANLARLRAEEIRCRQRTFLGESNVLRFQTGRRFKLEDHYRSDFNQDLLLHQVVHSGSQLSAGLGAAAKQVEKPVYRNEFVCGDSKVPYRPERLTPKPRIVGTVNAKVDAGGDGQYAEIDDQGRYKVVSPFDQRVGDLSDMAGGRGSRWIRKAEPYAGADYGIHFPLHKKTEVLLTHIDGDPDRPIICGSVPNPETASPVSSKNQTKSVVRTAGGNHIAIEDNAGGEQIHMYSPHGETKLWIGAPNQGEGFGVKTLLHELHEIGGHAYEKIGEWAYKDVKGDYQMFVGGDETKYLKGALSLKIDGTSAKVHGGLVSDTFLGGKNSNFIGYSLDTCLARKVTLTKSWQYDRSSGKRIERGDTDKDVVIKATLKLDSAVETKVIGGGGDADYCKLTLDSGQAELMCGSSKIIIKQDGTVTVLSNSDLAIVAKGKVFINAKGGEIHHKGDLLKHTGPIKHKNLEVT